MTAQAAAAVLNRSDRQLRTYAQQGRLRTRRRGPGGRVEYRAADVYALAAELSPDATPPRVEIAEIVPSNELARRVEALTTALLEAQARAERAETALRLLPPPDEARRLAADAEAARADAAALRAELGATRGSARAAWLVAIVALAVTLAAIGIVFVLILTR